MSRAQPRGAGLGVWFLKRFSMWIPSCNATTDWAPYFTEVWFERVPATGVANFQGHWCVSWSNSQPKPPRKRTNLEWKLRNSWLIFLWGFACWSGLVWKLKNLPCDSLTRCFWCWDQQSYQVYMVLGFSPAPSCWWVLNSHQFRKSMGFSASGSMISALSFMRSKLSACECIIVALGKVLCWLRVCPPTNRQAPQILLQNQ